MLGLSARYFVFCLLFLLSHLHAICSLPFSNSTSSVKHLCSPEESSALLHFKNSLSIERDLCAHCDLSYRKTESWKHDSDCCTWEGVSCDELTGHVIGLDLSCAGLSGSLHDNNSLFLLRHLQRLNLACGDFGYSKISSNFGGFSELTHLDLSSSSIIDPFPSEISHLSKLISLDLSSNHFTLNQHTFDKLLKNLTQLRNLILDQADMSLVVPESLTIVSTSLKSLSLRNTGLQGKFPVELFHLPFLQLLLLSGNGGLTGELPKSNWSSPLEVLELSYSGFSGILPESIGNLRYLDALDLSNSHFSSQVPASLSNLEQLTRLDLRENNFAGLCGLPLSKVCGNGGASEVVPSTFNEEEEDDTWKWFWRITAMGYGCGVVIGVSTTYMIFATGKPFWVIKLYKRLRQSRKNFKRPRERRRVGRGN